MKRLWAAFVLAVLVHCGLLLADFGWLPDRTVPPRISRFVTVTMSYRQKAARADAAEKEEPPTAREPVEPKNLKAPTIRQKPSAEKPIDKPAEPRAVPSEVPRDSGQEKKPDATRSTEDRSVDAGMVQEAIPLYRINPPPRYPRRARRRGIQGTVVLSVYVDEQGRADNLWVFESSGYRMLDSAALEAVKKWSFDPGKSGDTPVAMWVNVPVRFELQ